MPHDLSAADVAFVERTARNSARRFASSPFYEDLLSAGMEAAVSAARRYVPVEGATFHTFLAWRVRGAVIDEWRRLSGCKRRDNEQSTVPLSLDAMTNALDLDGTPPCLSDFSDFTEQIVGKALVSFVLDKLDFRDRYLVEERYVNGRTQEDIAAELGITGSRVCQVERVMRRRVRELVR